MGTWRGQSCIILFCTVCILALRPSLGNTIYIGDVLPRDPKVWEGGTLRLKCRVTNKTFNQEWISRSLYFLRGNQRIPDRYVRTEDSREVRLTLNDINISHQGTYYCRLNYSSYHPWVNAQYITVYRKPVPVEELECVVHDWAWMRCTWDLRVKYHHPSDVTVSLVWVIEGLGNSQYDCPKKHFTNRSCEWKEFDGQDSFKPDVTYKMAVIVKNVMKEVMEQSKHTIFTVNTKEMVKPARVHNLSAKPTNSTCVNVMWDNRKRHRLKTCEILLHSKWDNPIPQLWDTSEDAKQIVPVCHLRPSVLYEISVRCRPRIKGFFSNRSNATAKMPEDVPSRSPEVTIGSYREIPNSNGTCQVTVYWKPIPEVHRNGLITAYHVSVNGKDQRFSSPEQLQYNQATVQLNCNQNSQIFVKAGTRHGLSSPSSPPLLIKALGKKLKPPEIFYVKADSEDVNKVHLFWDKPETGFELVTHYTIYYCQALKQQQKCKGSTAAVDGDLAWIQLPASQRNYTMVLPAASDDYMFGLSADSAEYSSGLVWSTCTYIHSRVPTNSPKNFRFADVTKDLSLTVQWEKYDCESSGRVLYYTLKYCQLTGVEQNLKCNASPRKTEIKPSWSSYTLTGLQDQKKYSISLQAVTEGGTGPSTIWINGTAVKTGLRNGHIAGIAVGAFIVLCFAVFGFLACGRHVKRNILDVPEESIIIPPPLPDPDRFDSYTDIPDYHTVGPSPAASPTSRTSLLSNGNSTIASTGSDSLGPTDECGQVFFLQRSGNGYLPNDSVKSVDKLGKSQEKKKKSKRSILPEGYFRVGMKGGSKSSDSLGSGSVKTLPINLHKSEGTANKDAVEMFMLRGGSLKVCGQSPVGNNNAKSPKQFLEVPPSQYQQNVANHVAQVAGCDPQAGSAGNGRIASSDPVTPRIRVEEMPHNCVGSAVSLASSGGVRRFTPPPEYASSTDRDLSDYGGYEEPITGPLSSSTPIATLPDLRKHKMNSIDRDDSLDQSYGERPKLTLDSRSLPSILECGHSHRLNSLEDSEEADSTLSVGPDSISGEGDIDRGLEVTDDHPACMSQSTDVDRTHFFPHLNGAITSVNGNGYIRVPTIYSPPSPTCPSTSPPSPPQQFEIGDGSLRPPYVSPSQTTDTSDSSFVPVIKVNPKGDYSKLSCSSVSRPISNYMKDLPAQYFLDPQALDDLPTTEL